MSDNQGQGTEPTANIPAQPVVPVAPPVPPQPAAPVSQAPAAPMQPAQAPAAPAQPMSAAPVQPQPPVLTYPQAAAWQAGQAGQPGQPVQGGQAFGVPPRQPQFQNQPTQPYGAPAVTTGAVLTQAPAKQKSGAGKVAALIVAAALVGGAAGLGGAYAGNSLFSDGATTPAAGPSTVTVNNPDSVTSTTAIAAKAVPSVVTIEATSGSSGGTGSGVILTEDGYIVTNTHVVTLDGATGDATIRVTTSTGQVYDAEVIGTDPTYDLAVIKLKDASGLTPIEFGDSSELNVGDQTVAVGAPLGLSNSVTTGIVSALNRSIEIASSAVPDSSDTGDSEDQGDTGDQGDQGDQNGQDSPFYFDFGQGESQQQSSAETIKIAVIQTDAAINPGNSGGALVNGDGKLIGINVAIASAGSTGGGQSGNIGVGFSIPSDIVQRVTDELIADGVATHGLLGASVQSAASVEGATITGAYIAEVVDGGAAAKAGLKEGDIVTAFNGVPITDSVDLTAQVRAAAAGSDATLTYVRDGKSAELDVTLGELPQ